MSDRLLTHIPEHAAQPAGYSLTTPAGIPFTAVGDAGENTDVDGAPDAPQNPPERPRIPLYKRRWFIITSIVGALVGIALLFSLLFPIVSAIVQLVVNRAQIDIERAIILNAKNDTLVGLTHALRILSLKFCLASFDLHLQGNVGQNSVKLTKKPFSIFFS